MTFSLLLLPKYNIKLEKAGITRKLEKHLSLNTLEMKTVVLNVFVWQKELTFKHLKGVEVSVEVVVKTGGEFS